MYNVYQHWDPLRTCLVGCAYPPEFYSFIQNPRTRSLFEKMSQETEEDYQSLIKLLKKFDVEILRPQLPSDFSSLYVGGKWVPPPTAPRDYFLMIHDRFWVPTKPNAHHARNVFDRQNPNITGPERNEKWQQFQAMDQQHLDTKLSFYQQTFQHIQNQGNEIVGTELDFVNGCFVSRIGHDLYFATQTYHDDQQAILEQVNGLFPTTRNHVVNAGGHGDATYCPVTPGLIISLKDIPTYSDTFPDWEVVYLPPSDYAHMSEFKSSMIRNKGRWFIPGFEQDPNLVDMVNHYFDEWVGYVAETVFDVNILIIDPKNIVVSSYNQQVEQACARYGIEVHVSPFRHRYFWDAGTHCITNDLHRDGSAKNWFPDRDS